MKRALIALAAFAALGLAGSAAMADGPRHRGPDRNAQIYEVGHRRGGWHHGRRGCDGPRRGPGFHHRYRGWGPGFYGPPRPYRHYGFYPGFYGPRNGIYFGGPNLRFGLNF